MASQSRRDLIDSITVDANGTDEQLAFEGEVGLPCGAKALDIEVAVLGTDLDRDVRRGLVASCSRTGRSPGVVLLADVRFEAGTIAAWLHAAFRAWLGLKPFHARQPGEWRLSE